MKTITDSLGRTEIVGDNVTDLAPGFRTNRQMMTAQILQSTKSAPYLRPQKTHVGQAGGASTIKGHMRAFVQALKQARVPTARGSTWTAANVSAAKAIATKFFTAKGASYALKGFTSFRKIKPAAGASLMGRIAGTDVGRVRTGRGYSLSDDMTGASSFIGRVRTGRGYSLSDDMTGANFIGYDPVNLGPGYRTNRQMMSAHILQSTKSAPYLRPQKTHVGYDPTKIQPGFRTNRQSMTARILQSTKSAPYLRPQKTHVGRGYFVGTAPPPAIASEVPPPIPGEPADVLVALTAAANQLGVPPTAAASMIAAKNAGDKSSAKEIAEAAKIYQASQKGDKGALDQVARVGADARAKNPLALKKAAALAAAIGLTKGHKLFADRKHAADQKAAGQQRQAAAQAIVPTAPAPAGFLDSLLTFGGQPGPFMAYYAGTRPQQREI